MQGLLAEELRGSCLGKVKRQANLNRSHEPRSFLHRMAGWQSGAFTNCSAQWKYRMTTSFTCKRRGDLLFNKEDSCGL